MTTNARNKQAPSIIDSRLGSALLIVVGTLALIAVFAAIYISIGQSDQRIARSVRAKQELDGIQNTFADHILGVIADDRLDLTTQHRDSSNNVFLIRETTDAPYTDRTMLSASSNEWERFNPSGRHTLPGLTADADFRVASDPWLASTSPTYLGNPGQPLNGNDDRPFGSLIVDGSDFIADKYSSGFLDNRDWLQISNLAPDGRFVNLFNLRPNAAFADGTIGGFDSESGTGTFDRPSDFRTIRRMSQYLSLWNQEQPADPNSRIKTLVPNDGIWLPNRNIPVQQAEHNLADAFNTPAVWTMYQRFAFLPLNQPFMTVNRNDQISTWADPDFAQYQWADADGDGMADARWFELTSAQLLANPGTTPREDVERLYDAGQYRLFAAARVVDLSSMVNVNTALDQLAAPEPAQGAPLGATPADVDLRRLLSMTDVGHNYSVASLGGMSPRFFHRPTMTSNTVNGNNIEEASDSDYFKYFSRAIPDPMITPEAKVLEPFTTTLSVGRYAYDAIKRGIENGDTPSDRYYSWPPLVAENRNDTPAAATPADFDDVFNHPTADDFDISNASLLEYRLHQNHLDPVLGIPMTAQSHVDLYNRVGRLDPFDLDQTDTGYAVGSLYNEDDLLELLAFHGLNDPGSISRLEKAAMGRMPSIFGQNQRAFTPLLSNRPLNLDRKRHGYSDSNLSGTAFLGYAIAHPEDARLITGRIAKESMAFFAVTPRRLLTTVSGGTTLLSGDIAGTSLTNADVAPTLESAILSPTTLFGMYQRALVGELNFDKVVVTDIDDLFIEDPTQTRDEETATLFYAHRGPELALRIAAHAAVNMKDMVDSDTKPTVTTLLMDNSRRDEFDTTHFPANLDPTDEWYRDYPGVADGLLLDAGVNKLPGVDAGSSHFTDVHRQAVNIYGIEPMPIITETASFYVFHDASESLGGDIDYGATRPKKNGPLPPVVPLPGTQTKITIDAGTQPIVNQDNMMHGIAFQLHNPFGTEISLGGESFADRQAMTRHRDPDDTSVIDTTANYQFEYYIEWHGYFFKLAEYQQYYPPSSSSFDLRSLDSEDLGVNNPAQDFGPDDGTTTNNGSYLNPAIYEDYVARNVVMQPGETRVFYAIADPSFDIGRSRMVLDTHWTDAMTAYGELPGEFNGVADSDGDGLFDGFDTRGWTGPAQDWLFQQFNGAGERPVMIHPMNPKTGEYNDETFKDYLNIAGGELGEPSRNDPDEVRLWRKIVTPAEETTDTANPNAISENLLHNDMLVDRMELISGVAQPITGGEVLKTAGFAEDYPNTAEESNALVRNDNKGFTIVKWAVTSRRDRDATDDVEVGPGQVREWMLSSRSDPAAGLVNAVDEAQDIDGNGTLSSGDFIEGGGADLDNVLEPVGTISAGRSTALTSDYETYTNLADMFALGKPVLVSTGLPPEDKHTGVNDADGNGDGSADKFGRDSSQWLNLHGPTLHEKDDTLRTNLRPEIIASAQGVLDAPRLADLLLPWGIGPTYTPTAAGSLNENDLDPGYYPEEWMTLTEALAVALGYENPAAGGAAADNIWANTFTGTERTLDNGHLAIDNYVAYYNDDTGEARPDFDVSDDVRRGTGVPMALGILDQARPITTLDTSADQLITPTFGQININTAPVEVLRLLPGLSPILSQYYPNNAVDATADEWWANGQPLNLPDNLNAFNTPDVAATMVGYRDRTQVQPRYRSLVASDPPVAITDYDTNALSFGPTLSSPLGPADNLNWVAEIPETTTNAQTDRQSISGIDGLRQSPGFASLGEVLAVTLDGSATTLNIGSPHSAYSPQLSIQQYATDTLNLDGISDSTVAMDPQLFGGDTNGATIDDYAERLAIADGILNTISVRSDFYAVWFVVHAYQESDVANLQPEDPLVPSIAKRYVMVVDRTNVRNPGDTPKVVFLREVPM